MREKLVAKCYLCAKTAGPLILEYYLLVSPLAEELEIYGVKIVERRSSRYRSRSHNERSENPSPDRPAFQRDCYANKSG